MTSRLLSATCVLLLSGLAAQADSPLPGDGFAAAHYEALWTKSPFTVAAEEAPVESPDYSLVGLARMDGVTYASVVNKQTSEHFMVTSDKPMNGLTLVSINRGKDPSDVSVVVKKGGESIVLKIEQASQVTPPMPMPMTANAGFNNYGGPTMVSGTLNIPPQPGMTPGAPQSPPVRFRPHLIHLPQNPGPQTAAVPPPNPAQAPANPPAAAAQ